MTLSPRSSRDLLRFRPVAVENVDPPKAARETFLAGYTNSAKKILCHFELPMGGRKQPGIRGE